MLSGISVSSVSYEEEIFLINKVIYPAKNVEWKRREGGRERKKHLR